MNVPTLVLWQILTALITAHAKLSTAGTALESTVDFYVMLLIMNWTSLILIYIYLKEQVQFVDYNENLPQNGVLMALTAVVAVFICASLSSIQLPSQVVALYVPILTTSLSTNTFSGLSFITSVLWNFALIANSEETTKLVAHNGIYLYLVGVRKMYPSQFVKGFCVVLPIMFWAVLHAYMAYVGPYQWQLVAGAFIAGIIIFAVLWKTKSLLAAIITHGTYNVLVITAVALGLIGIPDSKTLTIFPLGMIIFTGLNIIFILLTIRKTHSNGNFSEVC